MNKGSKHSIEAIEKQKKSHKGAIAWNKGKTKETDERVKRYAETLKIRGIKPSFKGRRHTLETKLKISSLQQNLDIKDWKHFIKPINLRIRNSVEYKLWRQAVFTRDNWTCIWCGSKKQIQADHIKPFAYFPSLRFAIDNGRTLCNVCHKTTDTYMGKAKKYEKNTERYGDK